MPRLYISDNRPYNTILTAPPVEKQNRYFADNARFIIIKWSTGGFTFGFAGLMEEESVAERLFFILSEHTENLLFKYKAIGCIRQIV